MRTDAWRAHHTHSDCEFQCENHGASRERSTRNNACAECGFVAHVEFYAVWDVRAQLLNDFNNSGWISIATTMLCATFFVLLIFAYFFVVVNSQIEINLQAIGDAPPSSYFTQHNNDEQRHPDERGKKGIQFPRGESHQIYIWRHFFRLTPTPFARTIFIALDAIIKRMTEERNNINRMENTRSFLMRAWKFKHSFHYKHFPSWRSTALIALDGRLQCRAETWLALELYFPNDINECCCVRHFHSMMAMAMAMMIARNGTHLFILSYFYSFSVDNYEKTSLSPHAYSVGTKYAQVAQNVRRQRARR